jgi:multidrug transporter EmrE-like cation transporter
VKKQKSIYFRFWHIRRILLIFAASTLSLSIVYALLSKIKTIAVVEEKTYLGEQEVGFQDLLNVF